MGILQRCQVTPRLLATHRERIALCRGFACLAEIGAVFGTIESNELERIIDDKTARRNAIGNAQWSRKYARYANGSVPDNKTIALACDAAKVRNKKTPRIGYWRDHPLWMLVQEPPPSLEQIRAIMATLPVTIRSQLFHISIREQHGRQFHRKVFEREHAMWLRKKATLNAFVALLALAREGEILEEDPLHSLPARCAFEIFPQLLLDNPHLAVRWFDLFHVLKLAFWSRLYYGGIYFDDYTATNAALGLVAKSRDRSAKLPWDARIIGGHRYASEITMTFRSPWAGPEDQAAPE